ncbi:hypothetical protein CR513_00987, partial [Mucuna pruriens]
MKVPPRFGEKFGTKMCKLKKSLYGLKQSPRAYFEKFNQFVKSQGYTQGQGDDVFEMNCLNSFISTTFEIKDLGSLRYFLGMEIAR